MNGPSQYELQILKNIQENKKVLASLGLDKFKVSHTKCQVIRRLTCTEMLQNVHAYVVACVLRVNLLDNTI